jgi:Arylsulfotransferase (ASST)
MHPVHSASRSTRRWLLVLAVGVAGAYLAGLLSPAIFSLTGTIYAPPPVEASGVVTYDRPSADSGYVSVGVLFDHQVQLIGKDGTVVHSWTLDGPLADMATMDPDGSLLYMPAPPATTSGSKLPGAFGLGVLRRVDWGGRVVWSFDDPLLTHDFSELPDGMIAALRMEPLPADISSRIAGGTPGTEVNGVMWANQIVEIDPKTKAEHAVFDIAKAWRPEDHPLPDYMPRSEWTHANSIFYTPSDPLTHQQAYLISFRDVSTILIVSRATGQIIWSYGGDWVLDQQHDATLLPNGHVLLFDDGQYRRDAVSASQLLEIDPKTNQVVWSYSGYGLAGSGFYSPITGGAQRLSNGDTLATLGTKGQLMEVSSAGKVVWDYRVRWGPADPRYPIKRVSFLFKSRSYPASEVDPLLNGG